MNFRINLPLYRGPLDLLLYLVRKEEVEITEIRVSVIAQQFLEYLSVLEQLSVDDVGEFIDLASTLAEMKSRQVLPHGGEDEEEVEDPRQDLVHRLLEYKRYRDAASILEERGRAWQQRYARLGQDAIASEEDPAAQTLHELELWDLVSAFGRIIRESQSPPPPNIIYDDTPLHVYMQRLHELMVQNGRVAFSELFEAGMHKSAMIGVFLAVLEMVRHHSVRTEQTDVHGEIWVLPGENFRAELHVAGSEIGHTSTIAIDGLTIRPK